MTFGGPSATLVTSLPTPMGTVGASFPASFGLTPDGALWGWGANARGQLGDGTTTLRESPVHISTLGAVAQVTGGPWHTIVA